MEKLCPICGGELPEGGGRCLRCGVDFDGLVEAKGKYLPEISGSLAAGGYFAVYAGAAGKRHGNEDSLFISERGGFVAAVVCDGMGGLSGGARASSFAASEIGEAALNLAAENADLFLDDQAAACEALENIVVDCSARLYSENKKAGEKSGTTAVLALAYGNYAIEVHVGDSRLYHLSSSGGVKFETIDHSPVGAMRYFGLLTEEESLAHPNRNMISSFVGQKRSEVKVSAQLLDVEDGDRLLLCTDGICGVFLTKEIAAVSESETDDVFINALIFGAIERGGTDNCTALSLRKLTETERSCLKETDETGDKI